MLDNLKPFNITSVCKDDIIATGKFSQEQIDSLDETDMERIASKLADDYCEQLFWSSLEIIAENVIQDK